MNKYSINENSEWHLKDKRDGSFDSDKIVKIGYRPFDDQFIYNDKNIVDRLRDNVSKHIINKDNICLIVSRQCVSDWRYVFISKFVIESNLTGTAGRFGSGNFFPLYLYHDINGQNTFGSTERIPNLNLEIVKLIEVKLGISFTQELDESKSNFSPIDIMDYIYAVLYSPTYRSKYNEFLKINFPRVPYPENADSFWKLVQLGGELRQIHLLESPVVNKFITTYPINGSNEVTKLKYEDNKVWINVEQYFDHVPLVAWDFYIGGYQPAQKWLKDRKGRILSYEDIQHYQKIIVALDETDRLMKEIDTIEIC